MVAATQIARRLGAVLPLAILALAMLLVVIVVLVVPDRRHREIADGVMDHLVRFAAVAPPFLDRWSAGDEFTGSGAATGGPPGGGPMTGETVVPCHWRNSPHGGPSPQAGDSFATDTIASRLKRGEAVGIRPRSAERYDEGEAIIEDLAASIRKTLDEVESWMPGFLEA